MDARGVRRLTGLFNEAIYPAGMPGISRFNLGRKQESGSGFGGSFLVPIVGISTFTP